MALIPFCPWRLTNDRPKRGRRAGTRVLPMMPDSANVHCLETTEGGCDRCGRHGSLLLVEAGEWVCFDCLRLASPEGR